MKRQPTSYEDGFGFWPKVFPNGACHTLLSYDGPTPRLYGLRSVKNLNGGIVRTAEASPSPVMGFAFPGR
jgi:hypothetical protein